MRSRVKNTCTLAAHARTACFWGALWSLVGGHGSNVEVLTIFTTTMAVSLCLCAGVDLPCCLQMGQAFAGGLASNAGRSGGAFRAPSTNSSSNTTQSPSILELMMDPSGMLQRALEGPLAIPARASLLSA